MQYYIPTHLAQHLLSLPWIDLRKISLATGQIIFLLLKFIRNEYHWVLIKVKEEK